MAEEGSRVHLAAADHAELMRLNESFCWELDRGTPEGFGAMFTEDAFYANGLRESRGRAEIIAFARSRSAHGPRTSRHVQSGLRLHRTGEDTAEGLSCCVTWAASALPPIADTAVLLVADFQDRYVRVDGRWLIVERRIVPIFTPRLTHD